MTPQMYEGDIEALRKWAVNRGGYGKISGDAPEPYLNWIKQFLPPEHRNLIRHWIGVSSTDSALSDDGEWVRGFPHTHETSMGWPAPVTTVITYLMIPEEGGEFALGTRNPDDGYTLIKPELGLTVWCDSVTWHGVRRIKAGGRISLLSTGFPVE